MSTLVAGCLFFAGIVAIVVLRVAMVRVCPAPTETFGAALQRLGCAYRALLGTVLASAWFWSVAAVWTALLLAYALTR